MYTLKHGLLLIGTLCLLHCGGADDTTTNADSAALIASSHAMLPAPATDGAQRLAARRHCIYYDTQGRRHTVCRHHPSGKPVRVLDQ